MGARVGCSYNRQHAFHGFTRTLDCPLEGHHLTEIGCEHDMQKVLSSPRGRQPPQTWEGTRSLWEHGAAYTWSLTLK